MKTLNSYIPLLRGPQQDYIVFCVQKYSDRPEFHRGLLPFLPCEEAAQCLQQHLEVIKGAQAVPDFEGKEKAVLGEKFIRQIISVFRSSLIYKASEDEASEVVWLNSKKLKKTYGPRYGHKFCINIMEFGVVIKKPIKGLVELQLVFRNRWKITGHRDWLIDVVTYLQDSFGYYPPYTGV